MMAIYEYLNDQTAANVTKAEGHAITKAHKVGPTQEDGQLYGVYTFRIMHLTIKIAELFGVAV